MKPKVLVVMPVRDEEKLVRYALNSLVKQTVKPDLMLLVDDGSTDKTPRILKSYARKYEWIRYLRLERAGGRNVGAAVARALILGVMYAIDILGFEWEYLLKVDADTIYERDYILKLLGKFNERERLGVASGVTINESVNPEHARGPGLMLRKIVWDQVRLKPIIGWDSYIVFKAQMLGWETGSFKGIKMYTLRKTSASEGDIARGKYKQGYASGLLGYTLPIALGRSLKLSVTYRNFRIFPNFMAGYISAKVGGSDIVEAELKQWVKRTQCLRLINILTLRRLSLVS
ncbi:MAG TPA: glycosyltransferase family 2 protein [Thermoprotei archaeon]|nr:glycosyltransferase family 2 protein [Thermoprotei archaeon]